VTRTVIDPVTGSTSFPLPQFALTSTIGKTNAFVAGWTAGIGLEYMLCGNIFVRGEWEYVQFMSIQNTSVTENNVRGAVGYKF
jgi:opacity protein-like surface antigen